VGCIAVWLSGDAGESQLRPGGVPALIAAINTANGNGEDDIVALGKLRSRSARKIIPPATARRCSGRGRRSRPT